MERKGQTSSTDNAPFNNIHHKPDVLDTPVGLGISLAGATVSITGSSFYQSQGHHAIHNGDVYNHQTVIENNTLAGSFVRCSFKV
jgi:hypothetical protein